MLSIMRNPPIASSSPIVISYSLTNLRMSRSLVKVYYTVCSRCDSIFRPVKRQRKPRQPRVDADDKGADGSAWTPATSTIKGGSAPSTALVSAAAARASQLGEICWKTSLNESRAAPSFPRQEQEQYGALLLNSGVTDVPDDATGEQAQGMDPHFTGKTLRCLRAIMCSLCP